MTEKKWPVLDNRTDQLSKHRPGKSKCVRKFCHRKATKSNMHLFNN